MARFEINLLPDAALRLRRRRLFHAGLLLYLAVGGAGLAAVIYRDTGILVRACDHRRETDALEERFRARDPARPAVPALAARLDAELRGDVGKLDQVAKVLERRVLLAHIFAGLCLALPPEIYVMNLQWDRAGGRLQFDLVLPIEQPRRTVSSRDLLAAWNRDPRLASQIRDLTLITTQRERVNGRTVFLSRFSAVLRAEGG